MPARPLRSVVDQTIANLEQEAEEDGILADREALGHAFEQLGLVYRQYHPRFALVCRAQGHSMKLLAFFLGEGYGPGESRSRGGAGGGGWSMPGGAP